MKRTRGHTGIARVVEVATLVALPIIFHYLLPVKIMIPSPFTYVGVPLMLIGLGLAIRVSQRFSEAGTSFQLHGESPSLITSGPFVLAAILCIWPC